MRKTLFFVFAAFLAALLLSSAGFARSGPSGNEYKTTRGDSIELYSRDKMTPNGVFIVSILKNGSWQEVQRIPCDRFSRETALEILGIGDKEKVIQVKIREEGGGAAYLDSVLLNSKAPIPVESAKSKWVLKKLSKTDLDVIAAGGKTFLFCFENPPKKKIQLSITGRIEPKVISKIPFEFPVINTYRESKNFVDFYTYRLGSNRKSLKLDGKIDELWGVKPLFKELTVPGSGHPTGYTYCWVANDKDNLYVSIDFTPDNTYDGSLDYTKVYVKTDKVLKEFRVSVPEQKWGKPAFTYTDKVAYQHKTYEFKIPLKEIGKKDGEIKLAIAAYGTAAPSGNKQPALAYDSANNRFLLVYQNITGGVKDIRGRLVNPDGTLSGSEIKITDTAQTDSQPDVAFDPTTGRFLVVWHYLSGNDDIYGQLVNSDGTLNGGSFAICNNTATESIPKVCYDSINDRFVVIFYDSRGVGSSIYGQIVNSDGTLFGTASDVNFVISDTGNDVVNPLVAFDDQNGRFLAAWNDDRNGNYDVYGQVMNADGSPFGTATNVNFPIANEGTHQIDPSIAMDSINHRYLLAWTDFRNQGTQSFDIYGQIVNPDGSLFNTASNVNFVISNNNGGQTGSMASYSRAVQRYIVGWQDTRGGLYGQYLQSDGTAYGTATDVNFQIVNASIATSIIEYNDSFANYLVAWENQGNPSSIILSILGAATPPDIDVDPLGSNFGHIPINTNSDPLTVTVSNNGTGTLFVEDLVKSGDYSDQFIIQNDNVSGQGINPAGSATFQVVFSPTSNGYKYATIIVPSNDPDKKTVKVSVFGNIVYPDPIPTSTSSPTATPTVSPTITPTTSPTITPTPSPSPALPPTIPSLVNPQNASTTDSTNVTFEWTESKIKDTITYQIYLGKQPDLSDAQVINVASNTSLPFKMAGMSVILMGIVFGAGWKKRDIRYYILLVILGTILITFTVMGCGGSSDGSGSDSPGTTTVTHTVNNLDPSTTYYWKIVAKNEQGGESSSNIWMFNTP